jgi:hypothetical protein
LRGRLSVRAERSNSRFLGSFFLKKEQEVFLATLNFSLFTVINRLWSAVYFASFPSKTPPNTSLSLKNFISARSTLISACFALTYVNSLLTYVCSGFVSACSFLTYVRSFLTSARSNFISAYFVLTYVCSYFISVRFALTYVGSGFISVYSYLPYVCPSLPSNCLGLSSFVSHMASVLKSSTSFISCASYRNYFSIAFSSNVNHPDYTKQKGANLFAPFALLSFHHQIIIFSNYQIALDFRMRLLINIFQLIYNVLCV